MRALFRDGGTVSAVLEHPRAGAGPAPEMTPTHPLRIFAPLRLQACGDALAGASIAGFGIGAPLAVLGTLRDNARATTLGDALVGPPATIVVFAAILRRAFATPSAPVPDLEPGGPRASASIAAARR
jgi:hypothetical protein